MRQCRLPVTLLAVRQLGFDRADHRGPDRLTRCGHVQLQQTAGKPVHEGEQQWVYAPRRPGRSPVTVQRRRIKDHPDPVVSVRDLRWVDCRARRCHVDQARRVGVPERGEVVNVHTAFEDIGVLTAHHQDRRRVEITPELVDGHPIAVADQPGRQCHGPKDSPSIANDRQTSQYMRGPSWFT